jgi:hypothetical protein
VTVARHQCRRTAADASLKVGVFEAREATADWHYWPDQGYVF